MGWRPEAGRGAGRASRAAGFRVRAGFTAPRRLPCFSIAQRTASRSTSARSPSGSLCDRRHLRVSRFPLECGVDGDAHRPLVRRDGLEGGAARRARGCEREGGWLVPRVSERTSEAVHGGLGRRLGQPPEPFLRRGPWQERRDEVPRLLVGLEGGSADDVAEVPGREDRAERHDRGEREAAVPERRLEGGEVAQHPHRSDAPAGGALAEAELAQAEAPQRVVAGLAVALPRVEGVEVAEEVDLAVALRGDLVKGVGANAPTGIHDSHIRRFRHHAASRRPLRRCSLLGRRGAASRSLPARHRVAVSARSPSAHEDDASWSRNRANVASGPPHRPPRA
jgi:hypothetical protein